MPRKSKSRLAPIASYHVRECVLEYTFARICVCTCHFTANTATSLSPFSSLPPSFASFYSSDPLQVQRHDLSFLLLAVYFVPLSYFVSSLLSLSVSLIFSRSFPLLLRSACSYASSRHTLPIFSTRLPAADAQFHPRLARLFRPARHRLPPKRTVVSLIKRQYFLLAHTAPCLSYTY